MLQPHITKAQPTRNSFPSFEYSIPSHSVSTVSCTCESSHGSAAQSQRRLLDPSYKQSTLEFYNKIGKEQSHSYFKGDPNWKKTENSRRRMLCELCLWMAFSCCDILLPFKVFWASNFWIFIFKAFRECYNWVNDGLLWNLNNPEEPSKSLGGICSHAFKKCVLYTSRLGWLIKKGLVSM